MLTISVLNEKAVEIAKAVYDPAERKVYDSAQLETFVKGALYPSISSTQEQYDVMKQRAETAEAEVTKLREANVRLTARNEQLEAANRVIAQQIESVKAA